MPDADLRGIEMRDLLKQYIVLVCLVCFLFVGCTEDEATPKAEVERGVGVEIEAEKTVDPKWAPIIDAAPDKASVEPKKERKVLVFTLCQGFKHKSIPYCTKAMEVLGSKTGAFSCDVSKDKKVFNAGNLAQYDAIIFNNTTKLTFDDAQRKAIMDFVKGGKGIVGIHAATDNFYKWPEAAEMMGGTFAGHPWRANGTWAIKIEDPEHPVALAFEGKDFKVSDEIYRTKQINLRENSRVLVGLDMGDEVNLNAKGVRDSDIDIAISWVRDFGKGRVFYCSFGHNNEIYWNPAILKHYLDGIQFALGDLDVDTTPLPFEKDWADIAGLLDAIADYKSGESRVGLTAVEDAVKEGVVLEERSLEIEKAMGDFLLSDATAASKQFVCVQLGLFGSEASAEVLGRLLVKDKTSDMARYALERIDGVGIDNVLLRGLGETRGNAQIGVVNSIGMRRMNSAVEALSILADADDKQLKTAVISALGQIASGDAAKSLESIMSKGHVKFRGMAQMSYLKCADKLAEDGKKKRAFEMYRKISGKSIYDPIRRAGFIGLVETSDDPTDLLISMLDSKDKVLQFEAAVMSSRIVGSDNIKAAVEKMGTLSVKVQEQLLVSLADTGDDVILPVVVDSVKSNNLEVRIAAIKALKLVGNAPSVGILAEIAANTKGTEQAEARNSLYGMSAKGIDGALLALLDNADMKMVAEVISVISVRRVESAVGKLADMTSSRNSRLAGSAFRAIGEVGTAKDVDRLIGLLVGLDRDGLRGDAEIGVVVLCRRTGVDEGVKKVVAALNSAKDAKTRLSLYKVLGRTGSADALSVLQNALKDPDDEVKLSAIRALSLWPEGSAAGDLFAVVKSSDNKVHKVLALRGFIKLVPLGEQSAKEKVEMLKEAMELSGEVNEKRMVLSSLSQVRSIESLRLCSEYLDDASVGKEAAAAVLVLAKDRNIMRNHSEELNKILGKVKQK